MNAARPRLLVTGFGPFPGAPENPTEALVLALAAEPPVAFGASAFHAAILPTSYRRSWEILSALFDSVRPDVVVHFGVSSKAEAITVERLGRNRVHADRLDVESYCPPTGLCVEDGPESLPVTLAHGPILDALRRDGVPVVLSEDAGRYVCNATLYRSLAGSSPDCRIGFVHVPPTGIGGFDAERLRSAARTILRMAVST